MNNTISPRRAMTTVRRIAQSTLKAEAMLDKLQEEVKMLENDKFKGYDVKKMVEEEIKLIVSWEDTIKVGK